jgi:hypothetical protein
VCVWVFEGGLLWLEDAVGWGLGGVKRELQALNR